MKKGNVLKLAQMSLLAALSIVVLYVIPTPPIFAAAPFLQYDAADVPILIGTMLFGPLPGLAILVVASAVQALTISAASGWIGFVMHVCASGVLVLVSGYIYKKIPNIKGLIIGLVSGSAAMTVVMIPLNYIFTGIFLGAGSAAVTALLGYIVAFNLIKAVANSAIAAVLFKILDPILKKITK